MKWFKKSPPPVWEKNFPEALAKRVSKIQTVDLGSWIDQTLTSVSRNMSNYSRNGEPEYLAEALLGAEGLNALLDSFVNRTKVLI